MIKLVRILFGVLLCITNSATISNIYAKSKEKQSAMPPAFVTIGKAQKTIWQDSIIETGSLAADNGTMIKSETSGRITRIMFKSGDYVKAGTPIVEIYPDILKGQVKKAEANLELAKIDYVRYKKLYQKGFFAKADLDQAAAKVVADEGELEQLKAQLYQTLIRAPFDGLLGISKISLGQYLSPGQNIVNIQALDPIWVDFNVPESYFEQIKIGVDIEMHTPAMPSKVFRGKIVAIDPSINQGSRLLQVRATIPNKEFQLLPGTFGEVTIYLGKSQEVLLIPQTAITYNQQENYVFRVIDQKAVKTKITLGDKLKNNTVIVTSGLTEQDTIVTSGQLKLQDGEHVNILPDTQKGTA